jgi:hypothetical protein
MLGNLGFDDLTKGNWEILKNLELEQIGLKKCDLSQLLTSNWTKLFLLNLCEYELIQPATKLLGRA